MQAFDAQDFAATIRLICIKAAAWHSDLYSSMVSRKPNGNQLSTGAARQRLRAYRAWDMPTRWFHWINAILLVALLVLGVAMLTGRRFGVGDEGRHQLQTIHVALGAALTLNLLWRCYWAFRGGRSAQWHAILPGGPGYWKNLRAYLSAFVAGHPRYYIGHNPLARLGVTLLFILLAAQSLSGLILVGIDQVAPPSGPSLGAPSETSPIPTPVPQLPWAIAWSAADAESLRAPLRAIHLYGFYLLVIAVIQHVVAVITTELREGGDLVSAMLTGWKSLPGRPEDEGPPESPRRRKPRHRRQ
ncbi:MAG: cytochrome b/b6 domain-containing protein [Stellaceae bacterium]